MDDEPKTHMNMYRKEYENDIYNRVYTYLYEYDKGKEHVPFDHRFILCYILIILYI